MQEPIDRLNVPIAASGFGTFGDAPTVTTRRAARPARPRQKHSGTPSGENRDRTTVQTSGVSLDSAQFQLQQLLASTASKSELTQKLVEINAQLTNALWSGHFVQVEDQRSQCTAEHSPLAQQNLGINQSSLLPSVDSTLKHGKAQVRRDGALTVISVPVFGVQSGSPNPHACFCIALNLGTETAEPFLLITQMIATTLSQWHERNRSNLLDWQIDSTTAIAELMSKVVGAETERAAAVRATNELATFLDCPLVAIGYCRHKNSKRTRLQSISGAKDLDSSGKQTRLIQSVLNETLARDSVTTVPAIEGDDRSMKLAHHRLAESHPNSRLVSSPLKTTCGKTIGAWICILPDNDAHHHRLNRFVTATSNYLADALLANRRASQGAIGRFGQQLKRFFGGTTGRITVAACLVLALAMMIPVPHRISCNCQLQPTVRRFAVAPQDGLLLKSFVQPGDLVTAGQVVAKMDDRELTLQHSDLLAQRDTALKKRDVNRTSRDAAATQIAELEIEQLDAKIALVNFQIENLEIRSAVDGIVLQGDLEDTQGAPVRAGDILVEVSPLDSLRLELLIPEADISFVQPEQYASFVLEGTPFETQGGHIESIRPASEIRDNHNVFVSELDIDNRQRRLRPGMQGRAKIAAGSRMLGWVLFHRPAERVYSIFR